QRVPVGRALDAQIQRVVGIADLVPILPAGNGIGAGREHLVNGIEAASEETGLRTVAIKRDTERENLARADQACGFDDILRVEVIEGANLIILAPAAPIAELACRLRNRFPAHLDVHRLISFVYSVTSGLDYGRLNSDPTIASMIAMR